MATDFTIIKAELFKAPWDLTEQVRVLSNVQIKFKCVLITDCMVVSNCYLHSWPSDTSVGVGCASALSFIGSGHCGAPFFAVWGQGLQLSGE